MSEGITKYVGYIFVIIGISLYVNAGIESYHIQKIIGEGNLIECEVVDERLSMYSKEHIYVYTIKYNIRDKFYKTDTKNNSSIQEYTIGDKLTLYYSKENPDEVVINNWDEKYGGQVIRYILASIFFIVGLICAIFNKVLVKMFIPEVQ